MSNHIRHGKGAVRPYLYGKPDLPDFVREVFGAKEVERVAVGKGFHVEAQIGDSMIVIEAGESFPPSAALTKSSTYVYVDDVDAAYKRAIEMGAMSITPPENKPIRNARAG